MTILINGLKFFLFTAVLGKLVCIQHVFVKYSKIVQQASEISYETSYITAGGSVPLF
jgi:hypothetical protein